MAQNQIWLKQNWKACLVLKNGAVLSVSLLIYDFFLWFKDLDELQSDS